MAQITIVIRDAPGQKVETHYFMHPFAEPDSQTMTYAQATAFVAIDAIMEFTKGVSPPCDG
jgi:hypothetical protein